MSTQSRMIIAVALCAIIYIVFDLLNPRPQPTGEEGEVSTDGRADEGESEGDGDDEAGSKDGGKSSRGDGSKGDARDDEPDAEGDETPAQEFEVASHELRNEDIGLRITNRAPGLDGIIEAITLHDPQYQGHDTATDPFGLTGTRTLEVSFADEASDFKIPRRTAYEVRETSGTHVVLGYASSEVDVEIRVELLAGYQATLRVRVQNKTTKEQDHRLHVRTRIGAGEGSRYDIRRGLCSLTDDFEDEDLSDVEDGPIRYGPGVHFAGVDSKYFGQLLVPQTPLAGCEIRQSEDATFVINSLSTGRITVEGGETETHVYGLYVGPKSLELLQGFDAVSAPGADRLEDAIDWGILGSVSESLGKLLLGLLRWFYSLVGNWGIAIVLITVLVKLATLPLTLKQMASMKKMKEVQPELAKIKEKYKDDRTKQGQEMQALFARAGVNPLAGCLPMLVQLPIWFALYSMLNAAVELLHVPFLWLPDLTQQDPFYALPLALGGLMIVQNRMMPTSSMGDETQAKMMRWVMPIMFTVFMLFLPSGLGVYIFANVALSIVQTAIQVGTGTKTEPAKA